MSPSQLISLLFPSGFIIYFFAFLIPPSSDAFVLEGSDSSYAKFRKWKAGLNSTLLLEFHTGQPDGLLFYTDDGGKSDFFELKLVEGALRLRYNLGDGTQMMTVGRHLNDGLWHRAEIRRSGSETSLTVDGFVTQFRVSKGRDLTFGAPSTNSPVYVGGIPSWYNSRMHTLSLPSVAFEPRFRGAIRNLVYASDDSEVPKPQDIIEYKGLVSGPGEACERHDPCQHGGFCISTDSGPVCDCKHIDFEGAFCERDKAPAEATFHGGEFVGYDFRESGGEPIVSTLDEVSFLFKTRHGHGLLFYSGDNNDYLALTLREGRISISINVGSGPLDATIHPDHVRFDDNEWHSVRVNRKVQEMSPKTSLCHITASMDGIYFDRWTLTGRFSVLSSNRVTVGGFDPMRPLPGITAVTNFIGCLRKVEYRADTIRLSLLELARAGNRLVSVSGRLQFQCQDLTQTGDPLIHLTPDPYMRTMSGGTVTFTSPESFLVLPSWNASRSGSISIKVRTTEPNGLILFASGSADGQGDFFAIEMVDGQIYLHVDLGTGSLRVQATSDSVDDGEWHQIGVTRNGRSGTIKVDDLATDFNSRGDSTRLDLDGPLIIGGLGNLDHSGFPVPIWTASLRKGFVGCVRGLVINGSPVDLAAIAQTQDIGSVRPMCQVGSAGHCVSNPCQYGGKCLDGWNRFICDCSHTDFTGPTCAKNAATLSFDATQHIIISYATPVRSEAHDITLRFRTNRPAGLLLSMGSSSSPDFLEVSLEGTRIKLRVRLGDREKALAAGRDLNDNQWHLVRIHRRGNHLRVQVDDIPPVTGEVLTKIWVLEVTVVLIGGGFHRRDEDMKLPPAGLPFAGHMQQLIINSQHIFEMIRVGQIENVEVSAKFGKSQPIIDKPVTFKSKHTFVGLPQLKAYSTTNIYFQFKTLEPDGLILYNGGKSQDFIGVEMVKGHLHYVFDLGDGPVKVRDTSRNALNDNRWHTVTIGRPNSKQHTLMVDESLAIVSSLGPNLNLDLNGILYLGGVPENMYDNNLPKVLQSRYGFVGCLASLDLGGEALNPTADALVPSNMVVAGCEDANERCTSDSCSNGGVCVEQWSGPGCDCDMTSYTGPTCAQESISYDFGPGRGVILFTYPEDRQPDTRGDSIAFGFVTADPDAVLLRIDSARSTDYLEIELMDGKVVAEFNMGNKNLSIGERGKRKVNDRNYHVVKFTRAGPNSTLQLDNWDVVKKYPSESTLSVFNSQAVIHVGGWWNRNKRTVERPFQGVLSGLVVNSLRPLDMATDRDPRVQIIGDVHQITSIGSLPRDGDIMQKTTASGTPGVMDDLVYSGASAHGCSVDDEDECVPVYDTGSGDDLITPVYVPPPTRRPATTVTFHRKAQPPGQVPCDDEDCVPGSGAGEIVSTDDEITTIVTTTEHGSSYNIHHHTRGGSSTVSGGVGTPVVPVDGYSPSSPSSSSTSSSSSSSSSSSASSSTPTISNTPLTTSTSDASSSSTRETTTTRFFPPAPIDITRKKVPHKISESNIFDFEHPIGTLPPTPPHETTNGTYPYVTESEPTLIIIIIIAVLMIIVVSILIIFVLCKRRDDPIYKIEDKGRYEYVPSAGGGGGNGRGNAGGRKAGVKEWYV